VAGNIIAPSAPTARPLCCLCPHTDRVCGWAGEWGISAECGLFFHNGQLSRRSSTSNERALFTLKLDDASVRASRAEGFGCSTKTGWSFGSCLECHRTNIMDLAGGPELERPWSWLFMEPGGYTLPSRPSPAPETNSFLTFNLQCSRSPHPVMGQLQHGTERRLREAFVPGQPRRAEAAPCIHGEPASAWKWLPDARPSTRRRSHKRHVLHPATGLACNLPTRGGSRAGLPCRILHSAPRAGAARVQSFDLIAGTGADQIISGGRGAPVRIEVRVSKGGGKGGCAPAGHEDLINTLGHQGPHARKFKRTANQRSRWNDAPPPAEKDDGTRHTFFTCPSPPMTGLAPSARLVCAGRWDLVAS
jgi:hypothetical protein